MMNLCAHTLIVCGLIGSGAHAHAEELSRFAQSPPVFLERTTTQIGTSTGPEATSTDTAPEEQATSTSSAEEATSTPTTTPTQPEIQEPEPIPEETETPPVEEPTEEPEEEAEEPVEVPPIIGSSNPPPSNPYDTGKPLNAGQTGLLLALAAASGVTGILLLRRQSALETRSLRSAQRGWQPSAQEH